MLNIAINAGDSVDIDYALTNSDGSSMDLTGASAKWGISPDGTASSATLTKTVGDGISITDAASGALTVSIDAGEIPAGHHWYELEVVLSDASSHTMARGYLHATSTIYAS
ncbi:MAG: hypothetical protein RIC14_05585 [Filomicrobium sp.]